LTTAVSNMITAYTDASGRAPEYLNVGGGNISGLTLRPGVYKWGTGVKVNANTKVYLQGGKNSVWIFQVAGVLELGENAQIILSGSGTKAQNIFWAVNQATLKSGSHFEGTILSKTAVTMGSGASLVGRILAQTNVTLISNVVTKP
jgi:hypothetical protein